MNVKRLYLDSIFDVAVSSGGAALPSGFVLAPGVYAVSGVSYDMTAPGVYFFAELSPANAGRRAVTNADPLEMASVIATAVKHGTRDNGLSIAQINQELRSRFIGVSCGVASPLLVYWLTMAGHQARIVRFITMESPNGYDDSHVAVEMVRSGSWMLVDADLGQYYLDTAGSAMSAADFVQEVPAWALQPQPLTPDPIKIDSAAPSQNTGGKDFASYSWNVLGTPTLKQEWVQRICQAVGIDAADGKTYWLLPAGSESKKAWVEAQDSRWKVDTDPAVWNARFY